MTDLEAIKELIRLLGGVVYALTLLVVVPGSHEDRHQAGKSSAAQDGSNNVFTVVGQKRGYAQAAQPNT